MSYAVEIVPRALKALGAVHPSYRGLIQRRIDGSAADPRPLNVKRLPRPARLWRLRVGDYRVVYEIDDAARRVLILVISHRSDVYRN